VEQWREKASAQEYL